MKLDSPLIERVATLARLELTADEKQRYLGQLSQILSYVEQVQKLATEGADPLVHTHEQTNIFRADVPAAPLSAKDVLANAPEAAAPFFRVPKVME